MKKVLVSSGFGAGWSSWGDSGKAQQIAEYKPIIDYLETGGDRDALDDDHPLVQQMMEDLGMTHFYTGGRDGLEVRTINGPYRIDEYDGNEYVVTADELWS